MENEEHREHLCQTAEGCTAFTPSYLELMSSIQGDYVTASCDACEHWNSGQCSLYQRYRKNRGM
ncbi:MAG: hypothetical protein AB1331_02710 [Bacillota bacterium]